MRAERIDAGFMNREGGRLFNLAYNFSKNIQGEEDAKDVAQETLMTFWIMRDRYNPEKEVEPMIKSIARSLSIDKYRKDKHSRSPIGKVFLSHQWSDDEGNQFSSFERMNEVKEGNPMENASRNEEREIIRKSLAILPEERRDIIMGHYFEGLSFEEISENRGSCRGVVKYLRDQALGRLKEYLCEKLGEEQSDLRLASLNPA
jgi:RNA polymerase sigma-70 factor, ECF subfamily